MIALFACLSLSLSQQRVSSLTGNIQHIPGFESKILGNKRNLIVYLPPGYDADPGRRYPVTYMHDGQNIFDGMTSFIPNQEWRADETAQQLIEDKAIPPIIIVGIDNAGMARGDEYLPTRGSIGDGPNKVEMGGKADLYGRMITDEIMPMINKRYRTRTGPQDTALVGSSFGGVVSLYLGLKHPDVFGRLGVVSPSVWWDNRYLIRQVQGLKAKPAVRIWLDIGSGEGYENEKNARDLKWALIDRGFVLGKDLSYTVDIGAEHNERAWAGRFGSILKFLWSSDGGNYRTGNSA